LKTLLGQTHIITIIVFSSAFNLGFEAQGNWRARQSAATQLKF